MLRPWPLRLQRQWDSIEGSSAPAGRLTKRYVRDRYFKLGCSQVRAFGQTKYARLPRFLGVYRYLWPETCGYAGRWLNYLARGQWAESFNCEVRMLVNAGMMRELWSRPNGADGHGANGHAHRD